MPELENAQHEQLAVEYLKDYNASRAGERAGYDAGYARRLIAQNDAIKARIAELRDETTARTAITADRIALEYARLAFSDARDVQTILEYLRSGQSFDDLPRDMTSTIREISVRVDTRGNETFTVKAYDKQRALDVLAERFWTVDDTDDALVTGIQALRDGGVPDMSEASDAPAPHNTATGGGLDDIPDTATGDDGDTPKWRKGRTT